MMDAKEIDAAAASLDEAERTRRQIGLLSLKHPEMTMDDAYSSRSRKSSPPPSKKVMPAIRSLGLSFAAAAR